MSVGRVIDELKRWGYGTKENLKLVRTTVCEALIAVRSAYLEDVNLEVLAKLRKRTVNGMHASSYAHAISRVLVSLGILSEALPDDLYFNTPRKDVALIGISPEWASWCKRWFSTSTLELASRKWSYYTILLAGRWLYQEHSEITSPEQWTRALAAEYVAAVDRVKIGQWCSGVNTNRTNIGKPLAPSTKDSYLRAMRIFFRDCKEWGWIQLKFDPTRALGTPSSITKLIRRDARVINDDIWAKMLCAGLNLTVEDLPKPGAACKKRGDASYYPLEMMKAVVIVWLFGGLRNDEIRRLRVGCVEWQRDDMVAPDAGDAVSKDAICLLRVPACKFSPGFVKPVDRLVGEVIERWERTRTDSPFNA